MFAFWVLDAKMAMVWEIDLKKKNYLKIPNRVQHHQKNLFDTRKLCPLKFGELSTSNLAPKIFFNTVVYVSSIFRQIHPLALYSN